MATKTTNLGLLKPAFNEFRNTWSTPINNNWDIIDQNLGSALNLLAAGAGSAQDLGTRLNVSLNADGTLKDIPEVSRARTSSVFGDNNAGAAFTLRDRIERADREMFLARQGLASLLDSVAFQAADDAPDTILSAPTGFLSFTGANVKVDGSVTPVVANINGYRQVVRSQLSTTISGAAGTYYVTLSRNPGGTVVLDRTGTGLNTGQISTYALDGKLRKFTDSTQNFVTLGIKPGDVIDITSAGSQNADRYVVAATFNEDATNLTVNDLVVIGTFVTSQSALAYKITNILAPTLGFTATAHSKRFQSASGLIYIGRAVFDGTNVTSVFNYALKGRFEQFFSITLSAGNFLQAITHQLGYIPSKLEIYASQTNDYSQPIEPLAIAGLTGGAQTLTHNVLASLSDTVIQVKNATSGLFYQDFSGVSQTTGYLLVRAER